MSYLVVPVMAGNLHYSQLQSLVARIQCGDLLYAMRCLLEDRLPHEDGEPAAAAHHSVYRQLLFLRCAVHPRSVDIGKQ